MFVMSIHRFKGGCLFRRRRRGCFNANQYNQLCNYKTRNKLYEKGSGMLLSLFCCQYKTPEKTGSTKTS